MPQKSDLPKADFKTKILGYGGVDMTVKGVLRIIKEHTEPMRKVAQLFKSESAEKTAYNVWFFLKQNTTYKLDKPGIEELRTPERLIADGVGDCDDYSTFSATVLSALGYKPLLFVVAFNNKPNYGHIYTVVNGVVVDGVMAEFNKHPEGITKVRVVSLDGKQKEFQTSPENLTDMQIQQLSGIPDNNFSRENIKLLLSGKPNAELIYPALEKCMGIGNDGTVYFPDRASAEHAAQVYYETLSLNGLSGTRWDNFKDAVKDTVDKVGDAFRSGAVTDATKKIAFAPARGAMLLLLELNFLKYASKLYVGYLTDSEAKNAGINAAQHAKAKQATRKFSDFWVVAGGDAAQLKKVVMTGRGARKVKEEFDNGTLKGLGEPATAAAAAGASVAASPFIAKIVTFFQGIKWAELFEKVKPVLDVVKDLIPPKDESQDNLPDTGGEVLNPTPEDLPKITPKKSNTGLIVGGVAAAAVVLWLMTK